ncbi:MAG: MMPL family transporter, partial [Planctomycetales bacterium]
EAFSGDAKSRVVLVVERPDGPLNEDDFLFADQLAERFLPHGDHGIPIVGQWTQHSEGVGARLRSDDGQAVLVVLELSTEFAAVENRHIVTSVKKTFNEIRAEPSFPKGLELGATGSALIGGDMFAASEESIRNTERTTVILVLVILLAVYRSPALVLIPLTTIVVSVVVSLKLIALLATNPWFDFQVFTTSKVFIVVILFGAGTDFCLFLIARCREETEALGDRVKAVGAAVGNVGHALAASAVTTIGGLGDMFFADFGKYHFSGPTIGICLAVALTACLTLAPALLRGFGRFVFWPFDPLAKKKDDAADPLPAPSNQASQSGFWRWTGDQVVRRPGLILAVCVLLLLHWAWHCSLLTVSYDLLNALGQVRLSKKGAYMFDYDF